MFKGTGGWWRLSGRNPDQSLYTCANKVELTVELMPISKRFLFTRLARSSVTCENTEPL